MNSTSASAATPDPADAGIAAADTATERPLAVVTGASSGIGLELARLCTQHGCDLVIAADAGPLEATRDELQRAGVQVTAVAADLATAHGVQQLIAAIGGRDVDLLLANAGHGLAGAFIDQDFAAVRHVIDTNVTGTLELIQRVARGMVARRRGRILVTGSIAGLMPGTFQAVYHGSKAFIDSFSYALRNELKDTGVTVTVLMPGATDTEFFDRAGMQDTKINRSNKDDPADVARAGFEAMMDGEADVVTGLKNKVQAAAAGVTPSTALAEANRRMNEPGSASR